MKLDIVTVIDLQTNLQNTLLVLHNDTKLMRLNTVIVNAIQISLPQLQ